MNLATFPTCMHPPFPPALRQHLWHFLWLSTPLLPPYSLLCSMQRKARAEQSRADQTRTEVDQPCTCSHRWCCCCCCFWRNFSIAFQLCLPHRIALRPLRPSGHALFMHYPYIYLFFRIAFRLVACLALFTLRLLCLGFVSAFAFYDY